jgi:hypothetical protein
VSGLGYLFGRQLAYQAGAAQARKPNLGFMGVDGRDYRGQDQARMHAEQQQVGGQIARETERGRQSALEALLHGRGRKEALEDDAREFEQAMGMEKFKATNRDVLQDDRIRSQENRHALDLTQKDEQAKAAAAKAVEDRRSGLEKFFMGPSGQAAVKAGVKQKIGGLKGIVGQAAQMATMNEPGNMMPNAEGRGLLQKIRGEGRAERAEGRADRGDVRAEKGLTIREEQLAETKKGRAQRVRVGRERVMLQSQKEARQAALDEIQGPAFAIKFMKAGSDPKVRAEYETTMEQLTQARLGPILKQNRVAAIQAEVEAMAPEEAAAELQDVYAQVREGRMPADEAQAIVQMLQARIGAPAPGPGAGGLRMLEAGR